MNEKIEVQKEKKKRKNKKKQLGGSKKNKFRRV